LHCYGKREYHSTIKTSHSYTQVRVSENDIRSHVDPVHLLTTFEKSAPFVHANEIVAGGGFIYDPKLTDPAELDLDPGVQLYPVPYDDILKDLADELGIPLAQALIMKNTLSVGASLALCNFDIQYIESALKGTFTGRKAKLVASNVKAAEAGFKYVEAQGWAEKFPYRLQAVPNAAPQMILAGTTAVALGKLKAGCKFQTYYPITPASDESVYLEGVANKYGMAVVQAEDEIASACMSVGGALTGVRSATSTSCPGFDLMAEPLGWACINEVPVVVFDYQRGAPSTGLPTRHEQGDLLPAVFLGHGMPPRIVVAPGGMDEYFESAFHAFNYADKYQTPVIVLTDKCVGNNTQTLAPFKEDHLRIDRGKMVTDAELQRLASLQDYPGQFKRFSIDTPDGVSPRPILGQEHGLYWNTGDESDEYGHITEDPANRIAMMDKRQKKMETALKEIPAEQQYSLWGPENADVTVLAWGSTVGPLRDAMPILASDGITYNILQVRLMWPFPAEAVSLILSKAKVKVGFEMNQTGQLAQLVRMETGIAMDHQVKKYQGRPISETEAVQAMRDVVKNQVKEVVLTYGN